MQNIDPLYFLQPIITIAFSVGIVVYWHYRRRFTRGALLYSFLAYAGGIAIKIIFQYVTYPPFLARFGDNASAIGIYFGLQTMAFEVGGAFLVAAWTISRRKLSVKDAEGYGLGLALWENAGFLGVFGLISLTTIYFALASGGSGAAPFASLINNRPDLFYPPVQVLPLVGWSLLERVTSLLFHFSWGYLCVLAAVLGRRDYFLLALPMGLIDFFVPFVFIVGLPVFELSLFALALGVLGLTLFVTKRKTKKRGRAKFVRVAS